MQLFSPFPPGSLHNQSQLFLVLKKFKALSEGVQRLNYKYDTDQGRVIICRRIWILYSIGLRFKVTVNFYYNEASLTTVHDTYKKAGVSKLSLKPLSDHINPNHLADLCPLKKI